MLLRFQIHTFGGKRNAAVADRTPAGVTRVGGASEALEGLKLPIRPAGNSNEPPPVPPASAAALLGESDEADVGDAAVGDNSGEPCAGDGSTLR